MNTFSTIIAFALLAAAAATSAPTGYGADGTPCPYQMHKGARSYPSSQRRDTFAPTGTTNNNGFHDHGHHHHGNGFNNHGNQGFNNNGQNGGNNGQWAPASTSAPASTPMPPPGSAVSLENTDAAAIGNNTLTMAAEEDSAAISGNTEQDTHAIMGAVQPGGAVGFLGPLAGMFPFATPSS